MEKFHTSRRSFLKYGAAHSQISDDRFCYPAAHCICPLDYPYRAPTLSCRTVIWLEKTGGILSGKKKGIG